MYPKEKNWISYAFHQLAQPIFQKLDAWVNANANDLSIKDFYKQIEHSIRIHMLVKKAEDKLHMVTMKPTGETVNNYYQRIFKLWQQAGITKHERVKKYKITLKLSILHPLIGQKHTKIMDVLDATQEIEHQKHQISTKFARDSSTSKLFQKTLESLGRMWKSRSLTQTSGSSNEKASSATSEASGSSSAALKNNGKLINTTFSSANSNAKFIPTTTKPAS